MPHDPPKPPAMLRYHYYRPDPPGSHTPRVTRDWRPTETPSRWPWAVIVSAACLIGYVLLITVFRGGPS